MVNLNRQNNVQEILGYRVWLIYMKVYSIITLKFKDVCRIYADCLKPPPHFFFLKTKTLDDGQDLPPSLQKRIKIIIFENNRNPFPTHCNFENAKYLHDWG